MAYDILTRKQTPRNFACQGFADDARAAITQSPSYFTWWYTVKSVGLGVAVGAIGFLLGRESMRDSARRR